MTKKERAAIVARELSALYPNPQIPLRRRNTFTFLVAVVLSAQCTDKRVNEVTPKLFDLADTPQKMAKLGADKILPIIKPCGLSKAKSQNIARLSEILVEKYAGRVPNTFEELESLPGVGHKTASVIMSQAFGVPAFPVDTHIHRLAARWKLSSGKSVERTESDLKALFPKESWGDLHLQLIYYGREHCTARSCKPHQTMCKICRLMGRK